MQKRLSSIPAPALAGVIREKTKKAAVAQAKNCLYAGAGKNIGKEIADTVLFLAY